MLDIDIKVIEFLVKKAKENEQYAQKHPEDGIEVDFVTEFAKLLTKHNKIENKIRDTRKGIQKIADETKQTIQYLEQEIITLQKDCLHPVRHICTGTPYDHSVEICDICGKELP